MPDLKIGAALLAALVALGAVAGPTHSSFSRQRQHPVGAAARASFDCSSRAVSGQGLEGFYRLGEGQAATAAADGSGRGLHGTYNGGVTLGVPPVNAVSDADTAASFSAGAQQYVETGGTFGFPGTASHSVTLWFRTPQTASSAPLPQVLSQLQRDAGGNLAGWAVVHDSGQVRFVRYDGGAVVGSVAVPVTAAMEQVWQHYAFTYDGTTLRAYLNGTAVASSAATAPIPAATAPARIGGLSGAPGTEPTGWLEGAVDDVAVWSRVLPATEVRALGSPSCIYLNVVDRTPGLRSHWSMNDLSGTTLADRGPAAAPCTHSGVTLRMPSALPSGSGTSVLLGNSSTITCGQVHDFPGTAAFSVEAWFSLTGPFDLRTIAAKAGVAKDNAGWALRMSDAQQPTFSRGSVTLTGSASVAKDTAWHHVVATYDGSQMRLYLDGAAAGSLSSTLSITSATQQLVIGDKGGQDNTSIYNRALTAAEVTAHWNAR